MGRDTSELHVEIGFLPEKTSPAPPKSVKQYEFPIGHATNISVRAVFQFQNAPPSPEFAARFLPARVEGFRQKERDKAGLVEKPTQHGLGST